MHRLPAVAPRALLASLCCALIALACAVAVPTAVAAPGDRAESGGPVASAAAPTTRAQAQRAALKALGAEQGKAPLIVFRGSAPLKPGTLIASAGLEQLPQALARSARTRAELLAAAGVQIVTAPRVARVDGEPMWFFYADEAPFQAYQHRGRVALVGVRSGTVTVSRRFSWPPLLNGRLPYFLRSYAGYRNPRVRAFTRLWQPARSQAKAGKKALAGQAGPLGAVAPIALATTAAPTPAQQRVAGALAAEGACTIRVGDTLGNFFDASSFDRTRALFGGFFNELAQADGRFVSARYRVATGTTLRRYVERLIAQRGCSDLLLYVAGGGYLRGEPAISVGIKGRSDGRVEQQLVTAASLRTLIGANPGARFHLLLDAPGSGGFLKRLGDLPNLKLFLASSRAGQSSFTALPGLVALDGTQLGNGYNADGLLEFSNRGLQGLRCFRDDAAEVDAAIAAKGQGLAPSFLAWMLRRAYELCGDGSLVEALADAPRPQLETPGYSVVPPAEVPPWTPPGPNPPGKPGPPLPPDPGPPLPPGPKNVAPTAAPVAVETEEDTPVAVTLVGDDSDGDPLAYTTAAPVPGGTVSGDGAQRTFTPAPDFDGRATFAYTVSDGRASATATVTVTVAAVDDAPVVDPGAGSSLYGDGEPPVAVAPALTVADVDSAQLDGATVTISGGYEEFGDRLAFSDQNGISGNWDGPSGTLTLTGAATVAAYQVALRTVAFDSVLSAPAEAPRTLTFAVENEAASAPATRGLTVDFREAPSVGGAGATQNWTEGDAPLAIYPDAIVDDPDSTTLASARVHFSGPRVSDADELVFADQGGITGSWDATAGVLTLTGPAPLAAWQAALRTVAFRNLGDDPGAANRTIAFQVSDGARSSNGAYVHVAVTPVDDPPRLRAGGGAPAYTEGDATGVVVDPLLEATDPDSAQLSGATIAISGGFDVTGDELLFSDGAAITGSWDGASGRLTLTGSASVADYQAALRSIRFRSTGPNPAAGDRTISFTAADATGSSTAVTTTVGFDLLDDAPLVTTSPGASVWGGADVAVDTGLTVADPDSTQLSGATVQISGGYAAASDALVFADQNGITGSWDALTGTLTLTGAASLADWQAALRSVAYRHTGPLLDTSARTASFTVENARSSAVATKTVAFGQAPAVTLPGAGLAYDENDPATVVDGGATVTDVDSVVLDGATVAITAGHAAAEDLLSATTAGTSIVSSFDGAAGTLSLTGEDTLANYQQVLRTVAYRNASEDPSTAVRTLEFSASDGLLSGSDTTTVTVTAVDDMPVLTTSGGSASYTEDDTTGVAVDPGLTVSDVDDARLEGALVTIGANHVAGEDRLAFPDQNGISGVWTGASGTLALTGEATVAEYQAALRSIRYVNDETVAPSTAPRTISFEVSDGSQSSPARARQVTVTAVNDAPQLASGATLAYTEDDPATAIDAALTLTDGDSATLAGATVALGTGHAAGEDVLGFVNQSGITGSFDGATGRLTLSGGATVAQYRDALRSVTYANGSEDPSEADRTVTFTVDDGGAVDRTASTTATVEVTKVNDAPVAPNATASAVGNTPLFSGTTAPAGLPAKSASGASANVLTGSSDVDGPGPLRVDVAASDSVGDNGGSVAWNADGAYTYRPATGFNGSETFDFVVTDQGSPARTATATLTVTVSGRAVYVDNEAPAGGDGRAETPYDTLAAADAAAFGAGDTIYVFRGDGTARGHAGGASLLSGQRLLGESEPLRIGADLLFPGTAGARPAIVGPVRLGSGSTVAGLQVGGSVAGPMVANGIGTTGGTLRDLIVENAGGRGVELTSASGSSAIEDVAVRATGGDAIALARAGTVAFAGTVAVDATGGAALRLSETRTSGTVGTVRATSGTGGNPGVSIVRGAGSLTLRGLAIAVDGPGLLLDGSEGIVVDAPAGSVASTGAAAVKISAATALTTPPSVDLGTATSTGGSHGLDLAGLGTGTFRAVGGTLSGHTTAELVVDGGSGAVAYGGAIGNGSGLSARVLNRRGGTVALSGAIDDTLDSGGGVELLGSDGGATVFSGAGSALRTGTLPAIRFEAAGRHDVTFSGGGLAVVTTTGAGVSATGSGLASVAVTGAGNTILASGGGTALRVAGPQIAAGGLVFQSIGQSSGTNAIVLNGTGSAGGLTVTGSPVGSPAAGSGGTLASQGGDAIQLTDVLGGVQLSAVSISNAGGNGIGGSNVRGFALGGGAVVSGSGATSRASGIAIARLGGTVALSGARVTDSSYRNVDLATTGSLAATIGGGDYSGTGRSGGGDDAIHVEADSGSPSVTVTGVRAANTAGDHVQFTSGSGSTASPTVRVDGSAFSNTVGGGGFGGGVVVNPGGTGSWDVTLASNTITGAAGEAITVDTAGSLSDPQPVTVLARLAGNRVGDIGLAGSGAWSGNGIGIRSNGGATVRAAVTGNTIARYATAGLALMQIDGRGSLHASVDGNTLTTADGGGMPVDGVYATAGGAAVDDGGTLCLAIGRRSVNTFTGAAANGGSGIFLRQRDLSTFQLPGYAGGARSSGDVVSYLAGAQPGVTSTALFAATGGGYLNAPAGCQPA